MTRKITVRGVSEEVARQLQRTAAQRSISLDALVLELLDRAVGRDERRRRLERYATATAEDADALDAAIREQRVVQPARWG